MVCNQVLSQHHIVIINEPSDITACYILEVGQFVLVSHDNESNQRLVLSSSYHQSQSDSGAS